MQPIKYFIFSFSITLLCIFFLNVAMDPFGLIHPPVQKYIQGNQRNCAVDRAILPEGAEKELKTGLLEKIQAKNIVVGSSRTLKIQRLDFINQSFVSFAFGGMGSDSYPGLSDMLQKHESIKHVLLGIEFYNFGNSAKSIKLIDRALLFFSSKGLRDQFLRITYWIYKIRGSRHFRSPFAVSWDILTEYISAPATTHSVKKIWRYLSTGSSTFVLELSPNSAVPNKCLVSNFPEVVDGAWDMEDGSDYNKNELLGLPTEDDFLEYRTETRHGGFNSRNYWNLLLGLNRYSDFKIAVLEKFLIDLERKNIKVVGFTSPFPEQILEGFTDLRLNPLIDEFNMKMSALFAKHGHQFIVIANGKKLGCDDWKEFDDPWHPNRLCMRKALKEIESKSNWPFLSVRKN